jgi:hypothetical protein
MTIKSTINYNIEMNLSLSEDGLFKLVKAIGGTTGNEFEGVYRELLKVIRDNDLEEKYYKNYSGF